MNKSKTSNQGKYPVVIMFSGLPGIGKTTLARLLSKRLKFPILSKDLLQSSLRRLELTDRTTAHGYHLLFDLAEEQLKSRISIILDGVFPMSGYREKVRMIAAKNGAGYLPIYCFCSDLETWKLRIDQREGNIPDWSPVGWDEVKRLEEIFETWNPETTLYLDTAKSIDENVTSILRWLKTS